LKPQDAIGKTIGESSSVPSFITAHAVKQANQKSRGKNHEGIDPVDPARETLPI
jgi:hypothetical protein